MNIKLHKPSIIFLVFLSAFFFSRGSANGQIFTSADLTAPMEETGVSARALGLGSAYVAVPNDVSAMSFNPASLGTLSSFQVGLHHNSWLDGFFQETLTASIPVKGLGAGGLELSYLDHGTFAGHDINGDPSANYSSYRFSASLGWGVPLFNDFYVGLSGRGLQQSIASQAFEAFALDGGLLWRPFNGFHAGLSYSNFGTYVDNFLLASRFRFGSSYSFKPAPNHQILVAAAFSREPYNDAQVHFGLEDCIGGLLSLRGGYQVDLYENEVSGFHGLSAGLGFHFGALSLDYAYLPMGDLGNSQRISVQYDFGPAPVSVAASLTPSATPTTTPTPQTATASATPNPSPTLTATPDPEDSLKLYFVVPEETKVVPPTTQIAADIKRLSTLIRENPKDSQSWMDLGRLYFQIGQKEWAIQCFDQVLRLKPDDQRLREWLEKYKLSAK